MRGLSLEEVGEDLKERIQKLPHSARYRLGRTHGNLSRIERGLVPYSQPLLELLADIYHAGKPEALLRDPNVIAPIEELWNQVPESERGRLYDVTLQFVPKPSETPSPQAPKPAPKKSKHRRSRR